MPNPKENESQSDFVSRCMGDSDMQQYEQEQRVAICYSKFRNKGKSEQEIIIKGLEIWLSHLK